MPEKFGGVAIDGLFDASSEGVVFVGRGTAARKADADQSVLAVVAVLSDKFLPGATSFADLVAVGVVVVMAVALHEQAVAFDVGQVGSRLIALAQQVTGRVVGVAALEQVAVLLTDAVGLNTALIIVLILAEQQTLLAFFLNVRAV